MSEMVNPAPPAPAARARSLALQQGALQLGLPIAFAAAVLGLWQALVRAYEVPQVVLPAPTDIAERIVTAWPFLVRNTIPTTLEALGGFVLAALLGTGLAVLLVYSRWARLALYPNVVFFQLIPKIALAPLFIVWLGIGTESRLTFSLFISFFPVVIATVTGLNQTPPDMLRLCRAFTASPWQVFAAVRFPYALPYWFSGLKIAVTFAIIGVVVGEFITAQAGLGYLILFAASQAETSLILASICALCVVGLALYGIVAAAEHVVLGRFGHR
jgi:NitT/TauT family transport system permease protein